MVRYTNTVHHRHRHYMKSAIQPQYGNFLHLRISSIKGTSSIRVLMTWIQSCLKVTALTDSAEEAILVVGMNLQL